MIRALAAAAVLAALQIDPSTWACREEFDSLAGRDTRATIEKMEWA